MSLTEEDSEMAYKQQVEQRKGNGRSLDLPKTVYTFRKSSAEIRKCRNLNGAEQMSKWSLASA